MRAGEVGDGVQAGVGGGGGAAGGADDGGVGYGVEGGEGEEEEEEEWGAWREHEPRVRFILFSSSIDGGFWAQPLRRRREIVRKIICEGMVRGHRQ